LGGGDGGKGGCGFREQRAKNMKKKSKITGKDSGTAISIVLVLLLERIRRHKWGEKTNKNHRGTQGEDYQFTTSLEKGSVKNARTGGEKTIMEKRGGINNIRDPGKRDKKGRGGRGKRKVKDRREH